MLSFLTFTPSSALALGDIVSTGLHQASLLNHDELLIIHIDT
jgi:hypothetical protein